MKARNRVRSAAELGSTVDDVDPLGDIRQQDRPVEGGVAASCNGHPLAAKALGPGDGVEDGAALVVLELGERWAIGSEGPSPGGKDDRAGLQLSPLRGGQPPALGPTLQAYNTLTRVNLWLEGLRLLAATFDQSGPRHARLCRDGDDRLFRV